MSDTLSRVDRKHFLAKLARWHLAYRMRVEELVSKGLAASYVAGKLLVLNANQAHLDDLEKIPEKPVDKRFEDPTEVLPQTITQIGALGLRISEIRRRYKFTQQEFANFFEVTQGTISRWESDQLQPDEEHLKKLCHISGLSSPAILRYGSSVPEVDDPLDIIILGYVGADHGVDLIIPDEEYKPKEYALWISARETLIPFRDGWIIRFRPTVRLRPEQCLRTLAIVKLANDEILQLREIRPGAQSGVFDLVGVNGAEVANATVEWASPVTSIWTAWSQEHARQEYSVDENSENA